MQKEEDLTFCAERGNFLYKIYIPFRKETGTLCTCIYNMIQQSDVPTFYTLIPCNTADNR